MPRQRSVHFRGRGIRGIWLAVPVLALGVLGLAGCTVHPPGERAERRAAAEAGRPFRERFEHRPAPPLPENPTPDDLVRYAVLSNAEVEQRYWEWRAAIEQVPQDGTQPTNLAVFGGLSIERGTTSLNMATLSAGNDPMADILLPPKLSVAARRTLENARAAGLRFRKAQYDLRNKVLGAYYEYALTAELIRLEEANAQLLQTTATAAEARNRAGTAGQQDLLKARNELDLSRNEIANMRSALLTHRAMLNALLGREPGAALPVPATLPPLRAVSSTDEQLLALAARQNPELAALAREAGARREGIRLARLQYLPDFSLTAGTDLKGIGQTLMGMVTVPLLRREAIEAAVAQAEANLRMTEAMRRQAGNDLKAQVVADVVTLRDADRQLDLFEQTILPRARQVVTVARTAYESNRASLLDLLDSQRSLIVIERLVANVRVTREKRLSELEAITASGLAGRAE